MNTQELVHPRAAFPTLRGRSNEYQMQNRNTFSTTAVMRLMIDPFAWLAPGRIGWQLPSEIREQEDDRLSQRTGAHTCPNNVLPSSSLQRVPHLTIQIDQEWGPYLRGQASWLAVGALLISIAILRT